MFFVHHIDSIIQIVCGVYATWQGYHPKAADTRINKVFRVGGPALIVIGGLLMVMPAAQPVWERASTIDGNASVEFPGSPTAQESVDTLGDIQVVRTSLVYDVPGKDIALFLSFSRLQPDVIALTDDQKVETIVSYFNSIGTKVIHRETIATAWTPIYRLTYRHEEQNATTQIAFAFVDENIYRAVASWTDSSMDKSITDRFIGSFSLSDAGTRSGE